MEAVIVSSTRVKFNFSLRELAENYRGYRRGENVDRWAPEGPFLCCWIAFMMVENCIKGKYVHLPRMDLPVRWDLFDIDETSYQFMNEWIDKVNPNGRRDPENLFNSWNENSEYCISLIGGELSGGYRQAVLDKALVNKPDVEFQITMHLDGINEFRDVTRLE
jgi:hypothetical protein